MRLGDVIKVNPESVRKGYPYSEIEYIDISSVGTGILESTKHMLLANAPSRAKRIVRNFDTLLATVRPNLRSFLFVSNPKPNTIVSTGFAVLRATDAIDPRFLYYSVTNQKFTDYLTANAKGAAYPAIDVATIERAEIFIPLLHVQQIIAGVLCIYDDLIKNNLRRISILEEMTRRIFEEWFVYFRFPGNKSTKMVKSEIGDIPEGWRNSRLEMQSEIVMGQSPKSEFYNEIGKGLPFHQGVTYFGSFFPNNQLYCSVGNRIAEAGDVLFSVRAPVGRINIAPCRLIVGRGLAAIRSKTGHQTFLHFQLRNKFSDEDLIGDGTIFNSVTKKDMHNIAVAQPPVNWVEKFEETVGPMWKMIKNLTNKNTNLRKQRDILLPKLISGEIDVSELSERSR